jgi:tripartite-type tricarboxylate transporter receptor subunit TctC
VHVPYKGGAEAMNDVVAGRVDFFFGPAALVAQHVRSGRLAALAVNGARRTTALPEVPTLAESGVANAEYPIWFGLFVPARTPRDVVDRLHAETVAAMRAPAVRDRLVALGVDPMDMSQGEFEQYVRGELEVNAALARALGVVPE